jgi:hypothetical protein
MAYYRKNKRRFDPRYFMNERLEEEGLEEMQVGDGAGPDWQLETPGTVSKKLRDAFAKKDEEDLEDQLANLAHAEDEELERRRIGNLEEGCGTEQTYFVDIGIGRAEFDDLSALIQTAQTWQKSGIDIVDASPEVLEALGLGGAEQLPNLMDEEPPLEE